MNTEPHPKISHLSESELSRLIARYYGGEKTTDLLAEYAIKARPLELYTLFPSKVLNDVRCPYCDSNLLEDMPSKTAGVSPAPYCSECGHIESDRPNSICPCDNCEQLRHRRKAEKDVAKRRLVETSYPESEVWEHAIPDMLVSQVTLRDAVYLLTFYRQATVHDNFCAGSPYASDRPLAPVGSLGGDIIRHLERRGLIRVCGKTSPFEAFDFNSEHTEIEAHYLFRVRYRILPMLPVGIVSETLHLMERCATAGNWSGDEATALELWQEIALHECLETFSHQAERHGLNAPTGDKTKLMFKVLLEEYSVAQIYNFVWAAARDAAAYYQRERVPKRQAANSMVGRCRSRADRARLERWNIQPYGRNYDRPRSELSLVLHDVFLELGERGFTERPSRNLISTGLVSEMSETD